jgi:flagellar M-ring protein FliF
MEALKQVWSRLMELFARLSPNARLIAALSAVALIVCIGWTVRGVMAVDTVYLLGGQPSTTEELTEMQTALAKAQLSDFAVEGNRIRVARDRQAAYIAALAENRALPESVPEMLAEAIDKVNWFTNGQQQADYKEAARLKGLTSILRSFDGVETAEVVFDKSDSRALRPERTMTALVAIKLRGGRPLDDERAAMFRSVLTAAIAGLAPQNVTVVDKATNRSHHYQPDQIAGVGSRYRDSKRTYEAQYEARVRNILQHVPGVIVSAEVELESAARHGAAATLTNQANLQSTVDKSNSPSPGSTSGSQGAANQPLDLTSATNEPPTSLTPTPISPTSQSATAPRDPVQNDLDSFVPKRVCLSIGVPTAYIENIWRQRLAAPREQRAAGAPAPDLETVQAQELANIRQLAAPFAQASTGDADAVSRVTVTPLSAMVFDSATQPSLLATAAAWLMSPWGPLVAVLTLIGGGWAARSMLRAKPTEWNATSEVDGAGVAAPRARNTRIDEPAASKPPSPFHERLATTNSLRENLADMVREDPDVAANILRNWIGNSST